MIARYMYTSVSQMHHAARATQPDAAALYGPAAALLQHQQMQQHQQQMHQQYHQPYNPFTHPYAAAVKSEPMAPNRACRFDCLID